MTARERLLDPWAHAITPDDLHALVDEYRSEVLKEAAGIARECGDAEPDGSRAQAVAYGIAERLARGDAR